MPAIDLCDDDYEYIKEQICGPCTMLDIFPDCRESCGTWQYAAEYHRQELERTLDECPSWTCSDLASYIHGCAEVLGQEE